MRIPYVPNEAFATLSPISCKILMYLGASANRRGVCLGRVVAAAADIRVCESAWRSAARELRDAGLIRYETTTQGFKASLVHTKRFTWIPSYRDRRLDLLTPRAAKTLVALCRILSNATGTIRVGIRKLALRMGKSRRTVHLGLQELTDRCIVEIYRTGRSSWFYVRRPCDEDPTLFRRGIAHRSAALLRLLTSSTHSQLSDVLAHAHRAERTKRTRLRDGWLGLAPMDEDRRLVRRRLERRGIEAHEADVLARAHTAEEVSGALELAVGRRIEDLAAWLWKVLDRRWAVR